MSGVIGSRRARLCAGVAAASVALAGCQREAPVRRETVVVVDTDLFTAEDVASDPEISPLTVIDTVRVDVLDAADKVTVFREFSATSRLDWPLSFAVIPPETGDLPPTRLRIRGFRAREAESLVEGDLPTLSPFPELAIDRVVDLPTPPPEKVERVRVLLTASCLSRPASFGDKTTCVDGAPRPFSTPLPPIGDPRASAVGGTTLGRSEPCPTPAPPGRVCIPGGLSVLGSHRVAGFAGGSAKVSTLPQRLVHVSPFYVDELELTVGRARRWIDRLADKPARTGEPNVPLSRYCTYSDQRAADDLPLNCVFLRTAAELCALEGGRLPTEAEWNHMATGRGLGWSFPWGESVPSCCRASVGRKVEGGPAVPMLCEGEGPEAVGAHRGAFCDDIGDRSRDGVLDLGGSLTEAVSDAALALDHPCWGPRFGILFDPRCEDKSPENFTGGRGGNWSTSNVVTLDSLRHEFSRGVVTGFRCVYPVTR